MSFVTEVALGEPFFPAPLLNEKPTQSGVVVSPDVFSVVVVVSVAPSLAKPNVAARPEQRNATSFLMTTPFAVCVTMFLML